ncbi:MAG: PAS domain S-box protein [Candidatus Omnitrophica bacterium]|nr:PAS domain S-box protein [Candidatus Omnitrophota bacterium]
MRKILNLKDLSGGKPPIPTGGIDHPSLPVFLLCFFITAISLEFFAELAESVDLIGRPFETLLNLLSLLIWGAAGIYVGLAIKEKPALRFALVAGSCLFVFSQVGSVLEDLIRFSGVAIPPATALAINIFEKGSRALGWGIFFIGLYLMVIELNHARNLLSFETEELRKEILRRRQTEAELRNKEDIYRQAIAQAEAVPYQRDYLTNSYTFLGEGIEKLTGYPSKEITPQTWEMEIVQETILDPEHEGRPIQEVLEDIRSGKINRWRDDCRIRTKQGETRWCTDSSIQILGEDGKPVGSVGILQDITEKKLAEEELKQRIEFERLVITISAEFLQVTSEQIDERIFNALRSVGEFAKVDRCFLYRFEEEGEFASITHEWDREGVAAIKEELRTVPTRDYSWLIRKISNGEVVQIRAQTGLPEEARNENPLLGEMRIGSFVFVPQILSGAVIGFIGFDTAEPDRAWPDHTVSLLRIIGQIFAYAQGRRANELAILSSKERYRTLFENSHDAIYMIERDGAILDVNPAFLDLFGYTREEVQNLDGFTIFASNEERVRFQTEIENEEALKDYEIVFRRKNGKRMDGLLTASVRRDGEGRIYAYQGIIRDITEKKKAEKSFRLIVEGTSGTTGEAFFSSLVRALAGVIGVRYALVAELVEPEGKSSRKLKSLAWWSGKSFGEPVTIELEETAFEEALERGLLYIPKGVHQRYPRSGLMDRLEIQCYMGIRLTDASGTPIGLLSVFDGKGLDMDPRTAENLLRIFAARASAELSRIQSETTRLELERQMFESQKIESLGVLAGGIAHDFNNLLTSILGNVCLAEYDLEEDSPLQSYLKNIELATQRAADLAQQMLAYSGRSKFVVEQLQINDILEEVEELLAVALPKNVVFQKDLAPDLPLLDGDATQLRQVFMNLIINAGESIGNKGGKVLTTTRKVMFDEAYPDEVVNRDEIKVGPYLEVKIADTGCGMDEETRSKIFDPFFTTKFTGRGLGLAAVLGIIRGHHGGIGVHSVVGEGTIFTILLPVSQKTAPKKLEQSPLKPTSEGRGLILIVDDEESVQSIASKILERAGYDILVAGDGFEGLQIFQARQEEIDLVLLDLNMPSLTGEETYHRLQSIAPGTRVLIMSGYSEQEAINLFDEMGYLGFLQKPFLPEVLTQEVKRALNSSNGSRKNSHGIPEGSRAD